MVSFHTFLGAIALISGAVNIATTKGTKIQVYRLDLCRFNERAHPHFFCNI